ncbi:hypothetical protein [Flavobacterium cellulosilyticum]|uniref:Uncharacterized protein n=1 Tax=Flavobacterium cellulosilyticum TaxID=2541731 RepID=A0A4V2YYP7_9FLAO|nr:hypothetical protein [Flavobacterium cellulosilyticum]TDD94027.1 hypothetical protein E0F76_18015 [Flavobacterium cellulosilyticum]
MRLTLNTPIHMQFKNILQKTYPWIGIIGSLCLIAPSLYNLLDEPFNWSTDHIILAAGLYFMIIFLKEIFNRIINLKEID